MKKSLIIALGAIALVACTKTSVSYEQTGEIGFAPVVRKNSTKAAVTNTTFPAEWSIKVFGYYDNSKDKNSSYADGSFTVDYLPGVEFSKKEGATQWTGLENPYYWPKTGSMLFAGFAPGNFKPTSDYTGVTHNKGNNTFSVPEFEQPDFSATKDLLYAGYQTSVLGETVTMAFSHALSWITVKAAADKDNQIKITKIEFVGLAKNGKSTTLPTWEVSADKKALDVFTSTTGHPVKKVTDANQAETIETNKDGGLVFPQTLTNDAMIVVSYEMNNGAGTFVAQSPFSKQLNELKSGAEPISKWEAGKHYIYIINFGATDLETNEIKISPVVKTWETTTVDGISAN